jgi:hypothetical protein
MRAVIMLGAMLLSFSVKAQLYGAGCAATIRSVYQKGATATGSIGYRNEYNVLSELQGGYVSAGFIAVLSLGAQINLLGEEDYETGVKPFHTQVLIGYMNIGTVAKSIGQTGYMVTGRFCMRNLFLQVQHTPGIEFYSAGMKFNLWGSNGE